jgi:hypothetical protein
LFWTCGDSPSTEQNFVAAHFIGKHGPNRFVGGAQKFHFFRQFKAENP